MKDFFQELEWRGFIHSHTSGVRERLLAGQMTAYIGFDPTASSLHVGSLLPIMGLVHFQQCGHRPIAIAGGGTGMIGDPSGKTQERKLLTLEELESNLVGIRKQLAQFLDFETRLNPALLVNNADWLTKLTMMQFLRDIGKHFSVNEMMAKDSVKNRLAQEQGMSYTEFTYSLLQAYDFLELHDRHGCTLQMGGSDQWGNIVAGVDLIRRLRGAEAHGIVYPLITTATGVKFGKTESGTVWLDAARTSPYKFYQFWYNTDDRDVMQYIKFFTFIGKEEAMAMEQAVATAPEKRQAQALLAEHVTRRVHGDAALAQARRASAIFFGGEIADVGGDELLDIFSDVPSVAVSAERFQQGLPLIDLLVEAKAVTSKGEARKAIQGGGIYLNNGRVKEVDRTVTDVDARDGRVVILRKGARNYFLVRIER